MTRAGRRQGAKGRVQLSVKQAAGNADVSGKRSLKKNDDALRPVRPQSANRHPGPGTQSRA